MLEYAQKQKRKHTQQLIYSMPALLVLGVMTAFMTVWAWNIYTKAMGTRENLGQINEVYEGLRAREESLATSVAALGTPFGVEAEIRDKYGLIKEGEETVVIVDENIEKSENQGTVVKKSWWQRVEDFFNSPRADKGGTGSVRTDSR